MAIRDEAGQAEQVVEENPNMGQKLLLGRDELDMGTGAIGDTPELSGIGNNNDFHPPYGNDSGDSQADHFLQEPSFPEVSEPWERMATGTIRSAGKGQGTDEGPCVSGKAHSSSGDRYPGHGGLDPSLELLVSQLLHQNAVLQQELVEARMYSGSGSGSNASGELRSYGRMFVCLDASSGGVAGSQSYKGASWAEDDELRETEKDVADGMLIEAASCQEAQVFRMSRCPSEAEVSTVPGDPLFEWYSSSDSDWEECSHLVPIALSQLRVSPASEAACNGEEYCLASVSWPLRVDIEENLDRILHEHQALSRQLKREEILQAERPCSLDGTGDQLRRLWEYEHDAARLEKLMESSAWKTGSEVMIGSSKSLVGIDREVLEQGLASHRVRSLGPSEH